MPADVEMPDAAVPEVDSGKFTVRLTNFTGPFDLLLQLIGKHKLDVTEIALHQVTDDFIAYIRAMGDDWDLGETSEFLLVAATLLDLKAARLLPAAEVEDEEDLALLEARDLLFARLLQYKAYKEAAAVIADLEGIGTRRWPRAVSLEPRYAEALPDLVLGIGAERLLKLALKQFLPKPGPPEVSIAHIHQVRVSVREHATLIRDRLRRAGSATFSLLIADCENTLEVVARFLALLELYREGLVDFEQPVSLEEMTVRWIGGDHVEGDLDIDDYEGTPAEPDTAAMDLDDLPVDPDDERRPGAVLEEEEEVDDDADLDGFEVKPIVEFEDRDQGDERRPGAAFDEDDEVDDDADLDDFEIKPIIEFEDRDRGEAGEPADPDSDSDSDSDDLESAPTARGLAVSGGVDLDAELRALETEAGSDVSDLAEATPALTDLDADVDDLDADLAEPGITDLDADDPAEVYEERPAVERDVLAAAVDELEARAELLDLHEPDTGFPDTASPAGTPADGITVVEPSFGDPDRAPAADSTDPGADLAGASDVGSVPDAVLTDAAGAGPTSLMSGLEAAEGDAVALTDAAGTGPTSLMSGPEVPEADAVADVAPTDAAGTDPTSLMSGPEADAVADAVLTDAVGADDVRETSTDGETAVGGGTDSGRADAEAPHGAEAGGIGGDEFGPDGHGQENAITASSDEEQR
ncbi:putative chromosome segregation and condensation protein A [Actinoplanes friuliensis DSM 7358]|uniref:Segregation and condensation protein A n=1 Tax=Actinoplanes friuliensis DSM 7358 TaxID=1246995 RepID=U5W4Y3_9ACTN|nr:putative chromosome segregation and condensation protein A [Actinoplanes friuliensis DSM 7358]